MASSSSSTSSSGGKRRRTSSSGGESGCGALVIQVVGFYALLLHWGTSITAITYSAKTLSFYFPLLSADCKASVNGSSLEMLFTVDGSFLECNTTVTTCQPRFALHPRPCYFINGCKPSGSIGNFTDTLVAAGALSTRAATFQVIAQCVLLVILCFAFFCNKVWTCGIAIAFAFYACALFTALYASINLLSATSSLHDTASSWVESGEQSASCVDGGPMSLSVDSSRQISGTFGVISSASLLLVFSFFFFLGLKDACEARGAPVPEPAAQATRTTTVNVLRTARAAGRGQRSSRRSGSAPSATTSSLTRSFTSRTAGTTSVSPA